MSALQWVEATTNLEKNAAHGTIAKVTWSADVACSESLLGIGMTLTELREAEAIKLLGFGKSFSSLRIAPVGATISVAALHHGKCEWV
jgi:hypothetical protein